MWKDNTELLKRMYLSPLSSSLLTILTQYVYIMNVIDPDSSLVEEINKELANGIPDFRPISPLNLPVASTVERTATGTWKDTTVMSILLIYLK
jgi:hypothetical protein